MGITKQALDQAFADYKEWSENYQLFKESLTRLALAGMERVFGNPHQVYAQNDLLLQLKACLHENQAIIDRVLIHFISRPPRFE